MHPSNHTATETLFVNNKKLLLLCQTMACGIDCRHVRAMLGTLRFIDANKTGEQLQMVVKENCTP